MERAVMASALASPPPPLPFGAPDLKRNARTFLERALVISAIVHLAAVGAFRATYERMIPKEEEVVMTPPWTHPTEITSELIPFRNNHPSATSETKGIIEIKPKDIPFITTHRSGDVDVEAIGREAVPGDEGRTPGPEKPPPNVEPRTDFKVAEIPPVPILAPLPKYPDFAREAGIEGRVIVRAVVGVDGIPRQVKAISGPKPLFDAAVEGVRQWRFKPGLTSGQPVEVSVEIPVVFRLGS
jgi:protein TonB